jgi:hypothetical protein
MAFGKPQLDHKPGDPYGDLHAGESYKKEPALVDPNGNEVSTSNFYYPSHF